MLFDRRRFFDQVHFRTYRFQISVYLVYSFDEAFVSSNPVGADMGFQGRTDSKVRWLRRSGPGHSSIGILTWSIIDGVISIEKNFGSKNIS